MPRETIPKERVFEETRDWLDRLDRQLSLFRDTPSLAPEQDHYTFENGTLYVEPAKSEAAFIPDLGFDGPA